MKWSGVCVRVCVGGQVAGWVGGYVWVGVWVWVWVCRCVWVCGLRLSVCLWCVCLCGTGWRRYGMGCLGGRTAERTPTIDPFGGIESIVVARCTTSETACSRLMAPVNMTATNSPSELPTTAEGCGMWE